MHIILERKEADEAMCWLSTMGGAFSALGEDFEHCVSYISSSDPVGSRNVILRLYRDTG